MLVALVVVVAVAAPALLAGPPASASASPPASASASPPAAASFTAPPAPQRRAYVQGDSVMVGALADVTSTLRADGWAGTITGFTGLHTYAAIPLFRQVRSTMGSVAVMELGANDCCDGGSFGRVIDQVMHTLGGLHVIWLTMPVWKPGVTALNQALWAASRRWPNLSVADWAGVLAAHPGYEYPDQVHLRPEGSALLASFIRQQLDAWFDGPERTYSASLGAAPALGGGGWLPPNGAVVAGAPDGDGQGLWAADGGGGVYSLGDAGFYGSAAGQRLSAPVVGMAATPDGHGYWLVGADGGVFSFGDAPFYGSAGAEPLAAPAVGMAPTPNGRGYWLVASDGGVFSYGEATFAGSAAASPLAAPVVGITPSPTGHGYWLVGSDGGVFSYGDAGFHGAGQDQVGPDRVKASYTALVPAPSGGYWLVGQAPALAYAPAADTTAAPGTVPSTRPTAGGRRPAASPSAAQRSPRRGRSVPASLSGVPSRSERNLGLFISLAAVLTLVALLAIRLTDRRRRPGSFPGSRPG
ncbi:MAG TPA: hypothetical protein VMU63_03775 [Acidimicrobiales bacterium]|nr:hypothetical protein [Acidimicrobiales bacterium]